MKSIVGHRGSMRRRIDRWPGFAAACAEPPALAHRAHRAWTGKSGPFRASASAELSGYECRDLADRQIVDVAAVLDQQLLEVHPALAEMLFNRNDQVDQV